MASLPSPPSMTFRRKMSAMFSLSLRGILTVYPNSEVVPSAKTPSRQDHNQKLTPVESSTMEEFDEEEVVVDEEASYDEEEVVDGEEEVEEEGEVVMEDEVIEDEVEEEEIVVEGDRVGMDMGDASRSAATDSYMPDESFNDPQSEVAVDSVVSEQELEQQQEISYRSQLETMTDEETGDGVIPYIPPEPYANQYDETPYQPPSSPNQVPPSPPTDFNQGQEPVYYNDFINDDDDDDMDKSGGGRCYWCICLFICCLLGGGAYFGYYLVYDHDQKEEINLREFGTREPTQAPTVAFTTPFDPIHGDCDRQVVPKSHPIDQCRCVGKIQDIPEDVVDRYQFHLNTFVPTIYPDYLESQDSCTARNQAMVWLSSANDYSFTVEERTERFALATLFVELLGTNWTKYENWLSQDSVCTWQGITCNSNGVLERLSLEDNQVAGRLPPEIALLKEMAQFSIARNEVGGAIPEGLLSISNLEVFDIRSNMFTGPIPPSIENATILKELYLENNFMSGAITQAIGKAISLEIVSIAGNEFGGQLPIQFFNLTNITSLNIGDNQFTGTIPTEFGFLTNLQSLSLGPNDFIGELPTTFVELEQLSSLVVRDIPLLEGRLPAMYAQELGSLIELIISDTGMEGEIETAFGEMTTLQHLELTQNKFRGPIPSELGRLSTLQVLDLSVNFLTGTLPTTFGNLFSLTRMLLNDNLFGGGIPDTFNNLKSLELLRIDGNSITGRVSNEVCTLRNISLVGLIVDCPFTTTEGIEIGVICDIPSCCSGCRSASF